MFCFLFKRNCRYALVPQPISSSVVRNLTKLAVPLEDLPKHKAHFQSEESVKNFYKIVLPNLETIESIDESFRQHLFAQWIFNNENKRFAELRSKLNSFIEKPQFTRKEILDPSDYERVNESIGAMITQVEVNKTHEISVVVPQALRFALFEGWNEKGFNLVRLLFHYGMLFSTKCFRQFSATKFNLKFINYICQYS